MNHTHKIFISYKHQGGFYWAQLIKLCILYHGKIKKNELCHDESLNSKWNQTLINRINNTVNVIVVFSRGFENLINCNPANDVWINEIELALKIQRNIIPVLVDDLTQDEILSLPNLPECIRDILDKENGYQIMTIRDGDKERMRSEVIWQNLTDKIVDENSNAFAIPVYLICGDDVLVSFDDTPYSPIHSGKDNKKTVWIDKGCGRPINLKFKRITQDIKGNSIELFAKYKLFLKKEAQVTEQVEKEARLEQMIPFPIVGDEFNPKSIEPNWNEHSLEENQKYAGTYRSHRMSNTDIFASILNSKR